MAAKTNNPTSNLPDGLPNNNANKVSEEKAEQSEPLIISNYNEFIKDHFALCLSFIYLVWTVAGILFSAKFYEQFNIPVLKYLEISDIFVAGIQSPLATIYLCVSFLLVAILFILFNLSIRITRKINQYKGRWFYWYLKVFFYSPKNIIISRILLFVILIIYTITFTLAATIDNVEEIKSNPNNFAKIYIQDSILESTCENDKPFSWLVLGSSNKFVFAYHIQCKTPAIVPIENISIIYPITAIEDDKQNKDESS